jgi:hypothetical protein
VSKFSVNSYPLRRGCQIDLTRENFRVKVKHPRCVVCGRFLNTENRFFEVKDVCDACSSRAEL